MDKFSLTKYATMHLCFSDESKNHKVVIEYLVTHHYSISFIVLDRGSFHETEITIGRKSQKWGVNISSKLKFTYP